MRLTPIFQKNTQRARFMIYLPNTSSGQTDSGKG